MNAEVSNGKPLVLYIVAQDQPVANVTQWTQQDWQMEFSSGQFVGEKIRSVDYDLIVDAGVWDLLVDLLNGSEKQSNRFLETKSHRAKFLVDLAGINSHYNGIAIIDDMWDQLGKHLAWRFCALDGLVWVRFQSGILMPHEAVLLESLKQWSGPGMTICFTECLEIAARKLGPFGRVIFSPAQAGLPHEILFLCYLP